MAWQRFFYNWSATGATHTETGGATVGLAAAATVTQEHVRAGAGKVEFIAAAAVIEEGAVTGAGIAEFAASGSKTVSVEYVKTGGATSALAAASTDSATYAETGGAAVALAASGIRTIDAEIGVSSGGAGGWRLVESGDVVPPFDEGRVYVKRGRAALEAVGSGTAMVDVDELARMIERQHAEDALLLVGVL